MNDFSRKLIVVLIFGVLPLLSIYLVTSQLIDFAENKRIVAAQNDLRQKLLSLAEKASPDGFYFNLFEQLFLNFREQQAKKPLASSKALLDKFAARYKVEFFSYVFNDQGELTQIADNLSPNRFIFGKIWDILAETKNYKPGEDEKKQLKIIQVLLGTESNAGRLKNMEGRLISLKKKGTDGFFYWKRFSPGAKAGVIFFTMPIDRIDSILQKHLSSRANLDLGLAYWSHESENPLFTNLDRSVAFLVRHNLEAQPEAFLDHAHRFWSILATRTGVFVGSLPNPGLKMQSLRGMLNLCFFILSLLMLTVLGNKAINLQSIEIRIGNKLTAILLVVIAIPVSALALTGIMAISDHERVLISRLEKEQKQRLSAIEDEFVSEEIGFKKICAKLRTQAVEGFSRQGFASATRALVSNRQIVRVELRGLNGDFISMVNFGGYFEGLEKLTDGFARHLIMMRLSHRLKDEKVAIQHPPDEVFSDMYQSSDLGFAQLAEAPEIVHTFRFGSNELFLYWSYIAVPGHPAALLSVYQSVDIARKNFLQRQLSDARSSQNQLGAYNRDQRIWLKGGVTEAVATNDIIKAVQITGRPELRLINLPEGRFVALAYPGSLLAPFSLLSLTSDSAIVAQLNRLSYDLGAGIFLIMFVALAIARLLARTFLVPITELDRGMRQLGNRSDDALVCIDSGDEFGELGKAFNQMVGDLKEMQLAKVVQESLFPQQTPQISGFDVAVYNLTATDLGGDYCDVIKLNDNNWLLLIGDVSGHGTPAALCMAMVKAAIFKACKDGLQFSNLPENLSQLLIRTLGRKKMMTMLFILLDPVENTMEMINAGHNWPLILRRDGKVEEIKILGMPLGARLTKKPRERAVQKLNPGDTLFCYTDALVECLSPQKEVFSHERLFQILGKTDACSAQNLINHIEDKWLQFIGGGVREDDLTMLLVKNCQDGVEQ